MSVVSVALLFAGVGSTPWPGMATVAVFDSVPVNDASIVAVTVYVAVPPARRSTVVAMLPDPLRLPHAEPGVVVHVHVAPPSCGGIVSATGAPVIFEGPAFETAIV